MSFAFWIHQPSDCPLDFSPGSVPCGEAILCPGFCSSCEPVVVGRGSAEAFMPGGRSAGCREYSNAGSTAMAARPAVRVSPAAWLISSLLGTIEPHDRVFLARV